MKIGVMGAMTEEVSKIQENLRIINESNIADRHYYSGELYGVDSTLVFSRWGKVAASSTATTLITRFKVDFIIFTGVAGAVSSELNIGDVIIGDKFYQHDMDARPLFNQFEIPLIKTAFFMPQANNVEQAKKAVTTFFEKIDEDIEINTLKEFSISKPKLHIGTIASGDQFVTNALEHKNLTLYHESVFAVEMEGAAFAQVF